MKFNFQGIVIMLVLTSLVLACENNGVEKEKVKKPDSIIKLETKELLNFLFDGEYVDSLKMVVWRPDFIEANLFQVSDDEKCYTSIDTIIKKDNYSTVIMSTSKFDKEFKSLNYISVCNACFSDVSIAKFYLDSGKWYLEEFIPNAFTRLTESTYHSYFNIEVYNEKFTFIKTEELIKFNNNSCMQYNYYDLSGNLVFECFDGYDNGIISIDNDFKIIKNNIEIKSSVYNYKDDKTVESITKYSYNPDLNRFIVNKDF